MLGLPESADMQDLGLVTELFFMAVYGYILFTAANLIGDGSERLLLVYGPGVVGGLVIPILGAIPDGAIIFFSGFGSDKAEVQKEIAVGVGTLAGSTICLLTVPFAFTIWLGNRSLAADGSPIDIKRRGRMVPKIPQEWNWMDGVAVEDNLPSSAKIMMITSLTFLIIQIPAIIYAADKNKADEEHTPALIGLIVSMCAFFVYSWYQLKSGSSAEQQKFKEENVRIKKWQEQMSGRFAKPERVIKLVFEKFDTNKSGEIDVEELQDGLEALGLQLHRQQLLDFLNRFDLDHDQVLDKTEFQRFAQEVFCHKTRTYTDLKIDEMKSGERQALLSDKQASCADCINPTFTVQEQGPGYTVDSRLSITNTQSELNAVDNAFHEIDDGSDEEEEEFLEMTNSELIRSALLLLFLGTALVTIFSDPMCETINAFAETTGIPSFYVSFVVTPLASNASEVLASLRFAQKKTKDCVTLSLSSLYGAACMNNTFCLAIFFALIYFQNLEWDFTAETITILLVIFTVGANGRKTYYRNWQGVIIVSLYFLSIVLIASLNFLDK